MVSSELSNALESLHINPGDGDLSAIRLKILNHIKAVHPDYSHGLEASPNTTAEIMMADHALKLLDQEERAEYGLVSVDDGSLIERCAAMQLATLDAEQRINELRQQCLGESRRDIESSLGLLRLNSKLFAAVCMFLASVSSFIRDDSLLGNDYLRLSLFGLSAVSGALWSLTLFVEHVETEALNEALDSQTWREILWELIPDIATSGDCEPVEIAQVQFESELEFFIRKKTSGRLFRLADRILRRDSNRLRWRATERIVHVLVTSWERQGIVERKGGKLEPLFTIPRAVVAEIRNLYT